MIARFPGTCLACDLRFPSGTEIQWMRGSGARHVTDAACVVAKAAAANKPPAAPVTADAKPIADFLAAAKARGLKFPKVRFLAPGGRELRLSVSGPTSKVPGSIQVVVRGDDIAGEQWLGRIQPDGSVVGRLVEMPDMLEVLRVIAADPATAAKEYGALMARCSFCDGQLTDEGSIEVGYGPTCARNYGLPHKAKGSKALSEVAA